MALLAVAADPVRWRLLAELAAAGTRCVCDLQPVGGVAPNVLSYHLKVLREAGLVTSAKRGPLGRLHPRGGCARPDRRGPADGGCASWPLGSLTCTSSNAYPPPGAARSGPSSGQRSSGGWRTGSTPVSGTGCSTTRSGWTRTPALTETLHFFLYDTVKITLLLVLIIFIVTVLRSYMSVERTRALLGGKREGVGNVMAAGLGVVTPFCSCSAVPAFIGFVAAGVPIGVTLSFLIASPMVNEIAIGMLLSAVRLADHRALHRRRAAHRDRRRAGSSAGCDVETLGRAVRVRDQAPRPGDRPGGRTDVRRPDRDGRRGGRHDPAQDLALPARRHRPRRGHPRLGPHRLLHHLRRTGINPFGVLVAVGDRRPALLQRRRDHAAGRRRCTTRACRWAPCSRS